MQPYVSDISLNATSPLNDFLVSYSPEVPRPRVEGWIGGHFERFNAEVRLCGPDSQIPCSDSSANRC